MNFNKVRIVLEREFFFRVKTKMFWISTLLVPFGFALLIGGSIAIQLWPQGNEEVLAIIDETGVLSESLMAEDENRYLNYQGKTIDEGKQDVQSGTIDGLLVLPNSILEGEGDAELIYKGSGGLSLLGSVRGDVRSVVREKRLAQAAITDEIRDLFDSRVGFTSTKLNEEGITEEDNTAFYSAIGFILGLIIFVALTSYGTIILKGVVEEKTNRIIEIIASSIKPIELLVGKILGISAVAIVQFGLWAVLFTGISAATTPIVAFVMAQQEGSAEQMTSREDVVASATNGEEVELSQALEAATNPSPTTELPFQIPEIPVSLVLYFFLFFILGYLLYSSLFAAIGSTTDATSDSQQLMMPVFIPIFMAYMFNVQIMQNPSTTFATVVSMIPLFTPINMITRVAISEVPVWQIGVSVVLMIGSIYGVLLISARIYRIGILQSGGKVGFKDLAKWLRQSN
ncbi:MAG TPA: ABC transporter permease [Bacteroidetes bacterium]|nr:MAG: ABC transporter permease [Rhodothermaeota bacterium MED-G64]HBW00382.1 ABC transporter permease [Bacteroidota bacterium]|tara:strand:- start:6662 stop:8032 length:1371 start_codon:yes stop_codon:yes gene_type:complete